MNHFPVLTDGNSNAALILSVCRPHSDHWWQTHLQSLHSSNTQLHTLVIASATHDWICKPAQENERGFKKTKPASVIVRGVKQPSHTAWNVSASCRNLKCILVQKSWINRGEKQTNRSLCSAKQSKRKTTCILNIVSLIGFICSTGQMKKMGIFKLINT